MNKKTKILIKQPKLTRRGAEVFGGNILSQGVLVPQQSSMPVQVPGAQVPAPAQGLRGDVAGSIAPATFLTRVDHARRSERALTSIPTGTVLGVGQEFRWLAELDAFMWKVLNGQSMPYTIEFEQKPLLLPHEGHDSQVGSTVRYARKIKVTPGWKSLIHAPMYCRNLYSLDLHFAPHLALMLNTVVEYPVLENGLTNPNALHGSLTVAEWLNNLVGVLRIRAARQHLQRKIHNWELSPRENLDGLNRDLNRLFVRTPSVVAVHWRFVSQKQNLSKQEIDTIVQKALYSVAVNEAAYDAPPVSDVPLDALQGALTKLRDMRNRFFHKIRNRPALIKHRRGMVWSIERSLHGGYELHVTMFFEATGLLKSHPDLEAFADEVGQYWGEITGSVGDYAACHRCPNRYGEWVFGRITDGNLGKLYRALGYLATRTLLVRIKGLPGGQYFGSVWFDEFGASLDPRRVRKPSDTAPIGRLTT